MATMTLIAANNAETTLAAGINSTATSLTVSTGKGALFPSPVSGTTFFKLTLIDAATETQTEIMHVTSVSSDTFTVVRGQEGTTARSWSVNDIVANMVTAGTIALMAQLYSPTLTGDPQAPTPAAGDNDRSIATTEFVTSALLAKHGNLLNIRRITNTGPVTRTAGAVNALWIMQGGGGGGGGAPSTGASQQACASGGMRGGYAEIWAPLTQDTYQCNVGNAGTAGAIGGNGGTGGDTSVTGIGSVPGGPGGGAGQATSGALLTVTSRSVSGATPTVTSGTLLKSLTPANGDPLTAVGSGASQAKGGDGGDSPFGTGGPGGVITNGIAGRGDGAGGGGGSQAANFSGAVGGAGTKGVILLMEFA